MKVREIIEELQETLAFMGEQIATVSQLVDNKVITYQEYLAEFDVVTFAEVLMWWDEIQKKIVSRVPHTKGGYTQVINDVASKNTWLNCLEQVQNLTEELEDLLFMWHEGVEDYDE